MTLVLKGYMFVLLLKRFSLISHRHRAYATSELPGCANLRLPPYLSNPPSPATSEHVQTLPHGAERSRSHNLIISYRFHEYDLLLSEQRQVIMPAQGELTPH